MAVEDFMWGVMVTVVARGKGRGSGNSLKPRTNRQAQLMDTGYLCTISREMTT